VDAQGQRKCEHGGHPLLEDAVIERETAAQIVKKRYKVMTVEDAFTCLLARLPVTMLA